MSEKELFEKLSAAVVSGDNVGIKALSQEVLDTGADPYRALIDGCASGMKIVSEKYDKKEMFVPQILLSSRAMYAAMEVLKPNIKVDETTEAGKVVIGTVEGDIHDIGKNIVKLLLDIAGFEVIDLGRSAPLRGFVETAKEEKADIIAMSALMSTSMLGMPEVIEMLSDMGMRDSVKVMVGGAPITQQYVDKIGADGFADNGPGAIKVAEDLMKQKGA